MNRQLATPEDSSSPKTVFENEEGTKIFKNQTDTENGNSTSELGTEQDEEVEGNADERKLRNRSTLRKPKRFLVHLTEDPETVKEALDSPEGHHWEAPMCSEMEKFSKNDVFELRPLPPGHKSIKTRWLFKRKLDADENVSAYKARWIAKGYSQVAFKDYINQAKHTPLLVAWKASGWHLQ